MRYFRLIRAFARYGLAREMEFSLNFVVSILTHLFFIGANLAFFSLIWMQVGGFGGLSPYEMLIFIGAYHVGDAIFMTLSFSGIIQIPTMVQRGDMDFMLTKPVPSQFLTTFRFFNWYALTDLIIGIGMIGYGLSQLDVGMSWYLLLFFLVLIVFGKAITYALCCLLMALSFTVIKLDAVWAIFFELGQLERYPMGIYPVKWKLLFNVILPTILVANFPAYFVLGKLSVGELLFFLVFAAALVYASHLAWQRGLKKYQSASS